MRPVPLISGTWEEGRLWDRWMIVHFLAGVSGGLSNVFFELSPRSLWLSAIALMILWEVIEVARGIREQPVNRVIDLLVGIAGVGLATLFAAAASTLAEQVAFVAVSLLSAFGAFLGWRAYRIRKTRKRQA